MSIIEAILLGLLQGLTEFIPISSSGHLLAAQDWFNIDNNLAFDVLLHIGTLLALLVYFWKDIWRLATNVHKDNRTGKMARLLLLATIPAATFGLLLGGYIDDNLREPAVVALMLVLVGLLMIYADRISKPEKDKEVTAKQGLAVGAVQAIALIPGTSRSGITITAGVLAGLTRQQAARFSFLLAIPIVAASAFGIFIKDLDTGSLEIVPVLVGIFAAFVSGLLAIRFMLRWIQKLGLTPFAIYRFILAALVLIFLV